MSNEELAVEIQSGAADRMGELWERLEGLVRWRAARMMSVLRDCPGRGVEFDDLCQSGYLALTAAVESYDPESGAFSTWLMIHLKKTFAEVTGYRTKKGKLEPLNYAMSLYEQMNDEPDCPVLMDTIQDKVASGAMEAVEERAYQKQLHEALEAALSDIPERFGNVVRMRYFQGMTLEAVGRTQGVCAERVRKMEGRAIRYLREPEIACHLRPFYEFDFYFGTGLRAFLDTGMSIQERYLMIEEERQERMGKQYTVAGLCLDSFDMSQGYSLEGEAEIEAREGHTQLIADWE